MENQDLVITVDTQDGGKVECSVLTTFEARSREYIALMPHDNSNQIQLFRYSVLESEDGINLESIPSDMEFEEVLKVFESLVEDYTEDE